MSVMNARHALISVAAMAVMIGLGLIGLAFGQSLRAEDLSLMGEHPLFGTGSALLTSGVVCAHLLFGFGRPIGDK